VSISYACQAMRVGSGLTRHGHGPSRRGRLRSPVCAKRAALEPKRSTQFQVVCFIDELRDINNEKGKGNPAELTGSRRA
jgi:hypothetical protein